MLLCEDLLKGGAGGGGGLKKKTKENPASVLARSSGELGDVSILDNKI